MQELAAGAQYAGDPQPYKLDEDEDEAHEDSVEAAKRPRAVGERAISEAQWEAAAAAIRGALRPGAKVLLVCHVNPDGDALGSMLGFALGLRQLGVAQLQGDASRAADRAGLRLRMPGLACW